jgi:hypothetical protein
LAPVKLLVPAAKALPGFPDALHILVQLIPGGLGFGAILAELLDRLPVGLAILAESLAGLLESLPGALVDFTIALVAIGRFRSSLPASGVV